MLADWLWEEEEEEEEREGRRGVEGAAEEQKKYKKMKEGMGKPEGGCGGEGGGYEGREGGVVMAEGGGREEGIIRQIRSAGPLSSHLGNHSAVKQKLTMVLFLLCVTVTTIRQREKGPAVKKSCISLAALTM